MKSTLPIADPSIAKSMTHTSIATRRSFTASLAALGLAAHGMARGATFPDRPLKLVLSYPPGGSADVFARIVIERLEKALGQPVVVDYRPGGSGTIAAEAAARAAPDGYTLHLMDSAAFAYVPNLRKVAYDPVKSFEPLVALGSLPLILLCNPALPVRNLQELVAYAKDRPGKLNYASAGIGSAHHLIGESFRIRAGIDIRHVPYRGAAQYIPDLMGGQVDLAVSSIAPAVPYLQSGRIRAVGVTTAMRSRAVPDVPTIAEQGFPGFDEKPWFVFVAPAAVSPAVVDLLRVAFQKSYQDLEVVAALQRNGLEELGLPAPQQLAEQMRSDLQKWGVVIKQANIKVDG